MLWLCKFDVVVGVGISGCRKQTRDRAKVLLTINTRIESMKMETVIRSPQRGRVKKLAHKEGVSC